MFEETQSEKNLFLECRVIQGNQIEERKTVNLVARQCVAKALEIAL